MKKRIFFVAILFCVFHLFAYAQTNKTRILVLGTSHLQQIKDFKPCMLDMVISKLDAQNFDVICIEKMPGELLNDIASRRDPAFDGITMGRFGADYLTIADTVRKTKNITFLEAEAYILAHANEQEHTLSSRKELLFNYLAATDLPSAALQYTYINNKGAFINDFEKYIASIMEKSISSHNEYYSLAVPLAKKETLNILEAIDNFQDEALLLKYYPEFIDDYKSQIEQLSKIGESPVYKKTNQLTEEGILANDLSSLYAFLNSDEYKEQDYSAQWEIWLKTDFLSGSDRARYSLWEMRNLQIAAKIMNVAARNPGKKILVIIGASHKGFLEEYLGQMIDVEILNY